MSIELNNDVGDWHPSWDDAAAGERGGRVWRPVPRAGFRSTGSEFSDWTGAPVPLLALSLLWATAPVPADPLAGSDQPGPRLAASSVGAAEWAGTAWSAAWSDWARTAWSAGWSDWARTAWPAGWAGPPGFGGSGRAARAGGADRAPRQLGWLHRCWSWLRGPGLTGAAAISFSRTGFSLTGHDRVASLTEW